MRYNNVKVVLNYINPVIITFKKTWSKNYLPSISGDIFGVTYVAYRWKISGVSYESHRMAELVF